MIGEAARYAAVRVNDVNATTALVIAGEGDLGAVGRKERLGLAPAGGEPADIAAVTVSGPDTAGAGEGNLRFADGRIAEKKRRGRLRPNYRGAEGAKQQKERPWLREQRKNHETIRCAGSVHNGSFATTSAGSYKARRR